MKKYTVTNGEFLFRQMGAILTGSPWPIKSDSMIMSQWVLVAIVMRLSFLPAFWLKNRPKSDSHLHQMDLSHHFARRAQFLSKKSSLLWRIIIKLISYKVMEFPIHQCFISAMVTYIISYTIKDLDMSLHFWLGHKWRAQVF